MCFSKWLLILLVSGVVLAGCDKHSGETNKNSKPSSSQTTSPLNKKNIVTNPEVIDAPASNAYGGQEVNINPDKAASVVPAFPKYIKGNGQGDYEALPTQSLENLKEQQEQEQQHIRDEQVDNRFKGS